MRWWRFAAPDPAERARLDALVARPFAHRGLHEPGVPENSRAAFRAAIARGHGIELDVQASRAGEAFCFHDADLERLTGTAGLLRDLEPEALARIRLSGSDETLPSLSEVLRLIGGSVPLLIEVKAPGRSVSALCRSVAAALESCSGPVGVMSFNPEVGRWFARHTPRHLRGLVVTEQGKGGLRGRVERWLALRRARPHFLAYDIRDLPSPFAAAARARGLALCTWTVRTDEERARAAEHADQIIYEDLP